MTTRILSVVVLLLGTVQSGPRPALPRTFDAVIALETTSEDSANVSMRRLFRLWLSAWLNFSLLPLRAATAVGVVTAAAGLLAFIVVVWLWMVQRGPAYGWGWVMAAVLVFSGTQLVMLGLIGEYLGRMFLTVNQRPQSVVREVVHSQAGVEVP